MWCHKGNREDECEEIDLKDPVLWQSMMGEATKWHQAKSESWISKRNKVTYDVRETITYHAGYLCARCCLIKMRGGQENMSSEAAKKKTLIHPTLKFTWKNVNMKYVFKKGFGTRLALGPIHSLSNSVARAFSCLFLKHFLQNYVDYTNYISAFHSSPVKLLVAAFWLSSTSEGRARDPVGAV